MMAALTASGGGVIRDILVAEIPMVLKADFYATAALIGGAGLVLARVWGLSENTQLLCAALPTLALRFAAMRWGIALPKVRKLPLSPSELTRLRKEGPDDTPEKKMGN